jgi:hypothetical protein
MDPTGVRTLEYRPSSDRGMVLQCQARRGRVARMACVSLPWLGRYQPPLPYTTT